jgi:hypothetical protein
VPANLLDQFEEIELDGSDGRYGGNIVDWMTTRLNGSVLGFMRIHFITLRHPCQITAGSSEWVLLSEIYHHVLKQSPSTERAKIEILSARRTGRLRLRAEQTREHVARPDLRLEPGKEPPKWEPATALDQPIPDRNYRIWDWERSYATRREPATKSLFEYVNIVGHRDDVLALWPLNSNAPADQIGEPPTVDPFRTGAPGRPSAAHFIVAEAKRRISSGQIVRQPRGLARFARDLYDWCSQ